MFTHSDALSGLLFGAGVGQWKIDLVADRRELVAMIADLHEHGLNSLCLNPGADGSGGEPVTLHELMDFSDSLEEVG